MTPQQKLREMRNKVIPPVLEFGCEVIIKDDVLENIFNHKDEEVSKNMRNSICTVYSWTWDTSYFEGDSDLFFEIISETGYQNEHMVITEDMAEDFDEGSFKEILGKPVSWNELLSMLITTRKSTPDTIPIISIHKENTMSVMGKGVTVWLDLSKEVEDQEEEVLNKLNEIL